MALYHVINHEATDGAASDALIVTNGRNKARSIFAERFGGSPKSLFVETVETNGEYVLSTTFTDNEAFESTPWNVEGVDTLSVPFLVSDSAIDRDEEERGL
jgi:hypothetical protein